MNQKVDNFIQIKIHLQSINLMILTIIKNLKKKNNFKKAPTLKKKLIFMKMQKKKIDNKLASATRKEGDRNRRQK